MKKLLTPRGIPLAAVLLGAAALGLRFSLYRSATDATGRLMVGTLPGMALDLLTLGVIFAVTAAALVQKGSNEYAANFSPSRAAFLGHMVLAAGLLATVLGNDPRMPGYLGSAWTLLGLCSAVCLVWTGLFRLKGRQGPFFGHMVPGLFLTVHMINHYQLWCSNPQFQDFGFALFATVCMVLLSYYQAAFDADMGSRRKLLVSGTLAVYLCLAELAVSSYPWLYAGGAVWAATGLCSWKAPGRAKGRYEV